MENKKRKNLDGKKIILGVCSSIAVYKAAELTSALTHLGADVRIIMTDNAGKLISKRIFQTLSRNQVYTSMWNPVEDWKPEHIALAESADILIVAPATANAIGNFACGLAPDMLSTVYMAVNCPVLIAPAMNADMYSHHAVKRNIETLKGDGVYFVGPQDGLLACGVVGKGRLADIDTIIDAASEIIETSGA
jgi:phosphopantothenoylcysteine decarboxylase/phosphopantothenate--cysteine ligase